MHARARCPELPRPQPGRAERHPLQHQSEGPRVQVRRQAACARLCLARGRSGSASESQTTRAAVRSECMRGMACPTSLTQPPRRHHPATGTHRHRRRLPRVGPPAASNRRVPERAGACHLPGWIAGLRAGTRGTSPGHRLPAPSKRVGDVILTRRSFLAAGAVALGLPTPAFGATPVASGNRVRLRLTLFPPTGRYATRHRAASSGRPLAP